MTDPIPAPATEIVEGFSQLRPTGSSLERAEGCPISFSLPQITRAGVFAEHGTAIHAFIRARLIGTAQEEALKAVPEELRDTCRGISLRTLVGDLASVRSEVAYAIDVRARSVVELGANIHRRYDEAAQRVLGRPLNPYEVALTIDVEGRSRDGIEVAGDVKTGFTAQANARSILPVQLHRQVHAEVTARALASDAPVVAGRLFKILEGGEVKIDPHVFEPLELDTIGDELLEIVEGVHRARKRFQEREELSMNPGPYCRYCPAASICPARVAIVQAVLENRGKIVVGLSKLSDEAAWNAWIQVSEGIKLLEEIKDGLKTIAAQRWLAGNPIASPDGMQHVRPIEMQRVDFQKRIALEMLHELGATEDQIAMCFKANTVEQYRVVNTKKPRELKPSKKKKAELAAPAEPAGLLPEAKP